MTYKYTPEQQKAIDIDGQNVLVSAGAGSGKTDVLTERVYQLIAVKKVPLRKILVVTFTNLAAHEMKDRIKKRLLKDEKTSGLARDVDSAFIMTFDAFSLYLVKTYYYEINLDPRVDVIDNSLLEIIKHRFVEEVLAEQYQNPSQQFKTLIKYTCERSDDDLKKYILQVDQLADEKLDRDQFLSNYIVNHFNEDYYQKLEEEKARLIVQSLDRFAQLASQVSDERLSDSLSSWQEAFSSNRDDFSALKINVEGAFPHKPKNMDEKNKDLHDQMKQCVLDMKELLDLAPAEEDYAATLPLVEEVVRLVNLVNIKLTDFKQQNNLYDFSDIAKLAFSILEIPHLQAQIKGNFDYIMIDEYQDTNDIQEAFMAKIANNNLYMVGDIKQSIYRFRNANSDIFANKYAEYALGNGGTKIDLNKNFRSREEVLGDINLLFAKLMSNEYGGANYERDHWIEFGNESYNKHGSTNQNHNLICLNYNLEEEEIKNRDELEATLIAQDIIQKINNEYLTYPKKSERVRPVQYKDFVILIEVSTHFDTYRRVFNQYNIPLRVEKDKSTTDNDVIRVFTSLIKLLSNAIFPNTLDETELKHAYMSVARSFLYEMDDQILHDEIISGNFLNSPLLEKINNIAADVKFEPLHVQVQTLFYEFKFNEKVILIGDVNDQLEQLQQFMNTSQTLGKMGYQLNDLTTYLNELSERNIDISLPTSDDSENVVRLMSIHKSKGLEFSYVYYPGLKHRFNKDAIKGDLLVSKKYGIIMRNYESESAKHLVYYLHKIDENRLDISERIRLFYVALTRAREQNILLVPEHEVFTKDLSAANNFLAFYDYATRDVKFKKINIKVEPHIKLNVEPPSTISLDEDFLPEIKTFQGDFTLTKPKEAISKSAPISDETAALEYGDNLHYLLSVADFVERKTPSYIDQTTTNYLQQVMNLDIFKDVTPNNFYREYRFYDEINERIGIIDAFILLDDKINLIDYKLKNIDDPAYERQIKIYAHHLTTVFKKPCKAYLVSIIEGRYIQVDLDEV